MTVYNIYKMPTKRCWAIYEERLFKEAIPAIYLFNEIPAGSRLLSDKRLLGNQVFIRREDKFIITKKGTIV